MGAGLAGAWGWAAPAGGSAAWLEGGREGTARTSELGAAALVPGLVTEDCGLVKSCDLVL